MIFWIIVSLITLVSLIVFFVFSKNNLADSKDEESQKEKIDEIPPSDNAYFKAQLKELEKDIKSGLISEQEAQAAKAELAREILRLKTEIKEKEANKSAPKIPTLLFASSLFLIGLFSFVIYFNLGRPDLPSAPLAQRITPEAQKLELLEAVKKVEQRLEEDPDDARGWSVLAPIYMQMQRFDDAVNAYRHILRLLPPNADIQTDLAEALLMANNGEVNDEIMNLLKSASRLDPKHVRSRFYLAGEAMRAGDNEEAIKIWQEILSFAKGDEEWVPIVQEGLSEAQARVKLQRSQDGQGNNSQSAGEEVQNNADNQADFILDMVNRLETRLLEEGGKIEEWTQLVRSLLVLGENERAQEIYNMAKQAYPDKNDRVGLDELAKQAGLE